MIKKLLLSSIILVMGIVANAQWVTQATGFATASRGIENISIADPSVVWASAYDGVTPSNPVQEFTLTIDGGITWTPGTINGATGFNTANIFGLNKDTAWVSMYNGTNGGGKILRTNDGGLTWTDQTTASFTAPAGFANMVYFFDANNGVAMGDPNGGYFEFYTTTDGGNLWTRVPQGNIPAILSSSEYGITNRYSVIGNTIWYGTNAGRVYKSTDMGYNWTVATTGLTNISRIVFKDANNGLFTQGVNISSTTDGGATWNPVTYTGTFYGADIDYVGGINDMYISTGAATGASGSSYSMDNGTTWINIDAVQHTSVAFYDENTGWTGGFNTSSTADGISKWTGISVGLITEQTEKGVVLYPNPSNGLFTVSLKGGENRNTTVTVHDIVGRIVWSSLENNTADLFIKAVDISGKPNGVYFVEVKNANQTYTRKIIKQ